MVVSSLFSYLFNTYLSPYVDELTANQLQVFAWSGQATLHNISVKPNAFDSLQLPFRVIHGHIGSIEASVPYMNLYTAPIVIKISDVYVVAVPNSEIPYNEEEEEKYEWSQKKAYLNNIEEMKQKIKEGLENKKADDGFLTKLIVTAIKNIQISINNVHVCFEDSTTNKRNPFQLGVSFSQLLFETEDNPEKKSPNEQIIHKLIKLEGFSLYLNVKKIKRLNGLKFDELNTILKQRLATKNNADSNLEYFLCPINFISEAVIHRKPEVDAYKIPFADLKMNLDHFRVQLTHSQINCLLLLVDSINRMQAAVPYRKWRPRNSIKENPISWWKFMYTAVAETGVRRKKREYSWANIQQVCKKRKQYVELYRQKILENNNDVAKLEKLEKDLNLITVVMARSQAELESKKYLESRKKENSKKGWFSGWWSSSNTTESNEVMKNIKDEFTPQEQEKLYKAIGYEENSLLQIYPPEYVQVKINFNIKLFKISIKNDNSDLANVEFNSCHFDFFYRPSSSNIFVKNDLDSLTIVGMNNVLILKGKQDKEFMSFKFEMNPLDKQFDFSVDLLMKSAYVMYDIETINQLYRIFKPPENVSLEDIQSYAQYKFGDLKQMTVLGLEYAIEKHKQLKLNIDIDPSFVIVPKLADLSKANSVLLLSLGKFLLTSKLVPKSNIPKVRNMMKTGKDQAVVMEEMKKLVYEKYSCHIQNIQVVLSDIEHWRNDIDKLDTDRHMIVPFQILLYISRSIIPQDPHFPQLLLNGEIPIIEVKASDCQISQLLGLFITLPYGPTVATNDVTDSMNSRNTKVSKLNVLNTEVVDAYTYVAKTIEKNEEKSEKNKEVVLADSVDGTVKDNNVSQVVYKNFTFDFKLGNIYLYLYNANRGAQCALARFHLDKFTLYGEILTDSTLWLNCSVSDLRLDDIRPNRKDSGIRILLAKSRHSQTEGNSILTVYIAQKSTERVIVISMSGFSFILALDYLLAIIDVSKNAFTFPEENLSIKSSEKVLNESKNKTSNQAKQEVVNIIEFDLKQMEVFILESLEVPNAAALVFTCHSNINLRLEQDVIMITGQVSKVAMSLANYMQYIDSGQVEAYIMSPTELTLNGSIKEGRQMIDLSFSDIYITISPEMINIVLGILSAMGSTSNADQGETSQHETSGDLMQYKRINRKVWYLNCAPAAKEALDLIKPEIFEDNQIIFNVSSIKVLFKSSGSSQPLLKFSLTLVAKLIANKNFDFDLSLVADYFNHALMAWEPLIEPINDVPLAFKGLLDLDESCKKVKIEALQNMEFLLTKSSINVLYVISNAFSSVLSYSKTTEKHQENRLTIRNYLGVDMAVMGSSNIYPLTAGEESTSIKRAFKKDAIIQIIKSGQEFHFISPDIANVKLSVNLYFSDSMVVQRSILCQNSSVRSFFTFLKTYPFNENWKWIVQVHDTGSMTKEVEFRSNAQIVNNFDSPFYLYSYLNNESSYVGKIEPLSTFYLPLKLVYGEDLLYIRPNESFELSESPLDWRNIELNDDNESDSCSPYPDQQSKMKYLLLKCWMKQDKTTSFNIKVRADHFNVLYEDTERLDNDDSYIYNIRLIPFVRLKNLLPYSIEFWYNPIENDKINLGPGEEFNLPYVIFGKTSITYKIVNYLNRDWTCKEILPVAGKMNEDKYYRFIDSQSGESIDLAVNFSIDKSSLILSLFSPYWMVNYTNELITYRADEKHIFFHPKNLSLPYLLCFDPEKVSKKNKLCLSIANSLDSQYFPLNVLPYQGSLMPLARSKRYSYYVNVKVELTRIGLSKIVSISSFYSIINLSKSGDIEYSENNEDWFLIEGQRSKSFFPTRSDNQTMCFRFAGTELASKHISLRGSSQTLFTIQSRYLFVEVDVTEMEAKIKISDYFDGAAPVFIVNDLKENIYYGQKNVTSLDLSSERHLKMLPPKSSVYFCWIEPLETREIVFRLESNGNEENKPINLDFDRYFVINEASYWITFFDGKQRVLMFTADHNLPQYLLKTEELNKPNLTLELVMKGLGVNIVNNEKKKDLLYMSINSTFLWEERKDGQRRFKEVSIKDNNILEELYQAYKLSINNKNAAVIKSNQHPDYQVDFANMRIEKPYIAQLRRASNRGLWFLYSSSEHVQQYHLKINRIQVDNQLPDHIYDVALSPVVVPKSVSDTYELQQKSFIEISAIKQLLGSVTRYKYIQVLIQEFMVQLDWGWINQLMNVFDIESTKEDSNKTMITKDLENLYKNDTLAEMQKFAMRKTYYDYLLLGPLKMHLSVALGDLPDGKFPFGLDFIIRFTSLTIGEINDALFKLDYFERKMVFIADSELQNLILNHYKTQAYMQIYKLLLGLEIIGNPMKFALGIKKGIGDFFYEPAAGIVHGPEEFAEGIANGVKSLASNVIGGTAGALGRIGNRLGTGVAVLTIDDKFQKERRERINRKTGFAESGKNLFRGFISGVTGVVTKPIEGAKEEGVEGLFKGVGRGVVGIVAQPATGVIDFASGSLHAFNNVIDPKQVAKPVRPPRCFKSGHEMTPYVLQIAHGNQILRTLSEGKFSSEDYEFHLQLNPHCIVLLTKLKLFYLKKSILTGTWDSDWIENWTNCVKVIREQGRVRIIVKESKKTLLLFSGAKEHTIVAANEEHIKALYNNIARHINPEDNVS